MDVRLPNLETTITIGPVATTGPIATRQKRPQLLALQSLRKNRFQYISTNILLTGGWPTPWKIWVRQIGSSSQLLGKTKAMFQTTNQLGMYEPFHEPFRNLYTSSPRPVIHLIHLATMEEDSVPPCFWHSTNRAGVPWLCGLCWKSSTGDSLWNFTMLK